MALSVINITPGNGAQVRTDADGAGANMQVIKLAEGTVGSNTLVPATAAAGLLVQISNASVPVTATVTGAVSVSNNPAVQQSGPWNVVNVGSVTQITNPVTVSGTVAISGTPAVSISGTPAVAQSGTWNIATLTTITNAVTVTGTVALSGTSPVSGTVTANQGTPAAAGNAWVVKLNDGTNGLVHQNVSGTYALPVKVLAQVGGGYSQQDKTAFTEGTTFVEVVGGVFNDAFGGDPSAGQASVTRITAKRALHINIRKNDGTELGIVATPLRTDPTGTTTQPVSGTVAATQSTPAAQANAWPVLPAPTPSGFWKFTATYSATQTDITLHTPAGGKTAYIEGLMVVMTTNGLIKIYDQTNAAGNMILSANPAAASNFMLIPHRPIPLSAINNLLRYSTGGGATGDITVWGFDA